MPQQNEPQAAPAGDMREELAAQVMALAQSRLTADLRFLSGALERLAVQSAPGLPGLMATDGSAVCYDPSALLRAFRREQHLPVRVLLHLTLHCLLGHPFERQEKDAALWGLACDVAVEEIIRQLDIPACKVGDEAAQDDWLSRLRESCPHMTAQELYNFFVDRQFGPQETAPIRPLFYRDSHQLWFLRERGARAGQDAAGPRLGQEEALPADEEEPVDELAPLCSDETEEEQTRRRRKQLLRQWKQLAQKAKADLQTFSRRHGSRAGALMDSLAPITFEECDYSEFLRRFGAQNEVMKLSDDEFDLIYYTYGLKTYGNIPLVEPLEYRDDKRIREFVIAIDTSGSVQGEIVQEFLQRTCNVLRQSGSFTSRVNIYLIQCDAEIQSVEQITSLESLDSLIAGLRLRGFGGTDFRPVFAYVDQLLEKRTLTNLNGLLYFTDGVGTYPEKAPDYKTAFIFNRDDYISPHVPSWAIRAVLTTENIRLLKETE